MLYYVKMISSTKPEVYDGIALSAEEDRAAATGIVHIKLRDAWTCGF